MPLYPFYPELCERPALAACILSAMPLLQGKSFLEVGCGNGYFCGYALSRCAGPVLGLDKNERLLNEARQNFSGCDFHLLSCLPSDHFEVILVREPLPVDADDLRVCLQKWIARLRPGGTLLLETPLLRTARHSDVSAPTYQDLVRSLPSYSWRSSGSADGSSVLCIRHRNYAMALPPIHHFSVESRASA